MDTRGYEMALSEQEDRKAMLRRENVRIGEQRDGAYRERNQVVAALARLFPSGIAKTAIPGWDKAWHGCVYIDLPTGQVSWHFHDSDAALFDGLPPYAKPWDGHDTPEKYRRLVALWAPIDKSRAWHRAADRAAMMGGTP